MPLGCASRPARVVHVVLAASCAGGAAEAAGIERVIPSTVRVLYEEGTYAEVGVSYADPHQSGEDAFLGFFGVDATVEGNTGDLFEPYWNLSGAFKGDIVPRLSYALYYDQPLGADTNYGNGPMLSADGLFGFNYDGTFANLSTDQFTGVLAYDLDYGVKLFGGLRAERMGASAGVPFIGPTPDPATSLPGYTVDSDNDWGYGYVAGAAWSRPDIGARVALTYFSDIEHDFETVEFGGIPIPGLQDGPTETDVTSPQSVTLDAQTGVAAGTLVFGSIRWVNWAQFDIAPPSYTQVVGQPLVDYKDDWWTYNLGVARELTDTLAGSVSLTYEPSVGGQLTTLGPYDGRTLVSAALSYDVQRFNVTGGITYGKLGDTSNPLDTDFDDGSIWGAGLRVGYTF